MDVVNQKTANKILPYIKSIENECLKAPISIHLLLTDYCVNKCNMCDHWKTELKIHADMELVKSIWNSMNKGGESVCLTGGDPTLHPNFNEILSLERNFELGFITTGNYRKDFDWELLKNVSWVRYSIDSLDTARYKIIRGLDNLNDTIIPNLKLSQKYNDRIGINFTIQATNYMDVKSIIRFCEENSIYRLMLYPVHGAGDLSLTKNMINKVLDQIAFTYADWNKIPENNCEFLINSLHKALDASADVREVTFNYTEYPCMINKIHLSIGADGQIFPCEMIADDTSAYDDRKIWMLQEVDKSNTENVRTFSNIGEINKEFDLLFYWRGWYNTSFCSDKCKNCYSRYQPIIKCYHENKGKKIFI